MRKTASYKNKQKIRDLFSLFPHVQKTGDSHGMVNLCDAYLQYLREHNYSDYTVSGRALHLYEVMDWCGQRNLYRPSEVTKVILQTYQRHLFYRRKAKGGKRLSINSQCGRLTAVRMWFKWLTQEDYLPSNPASELRMPRQEKRLPQNILTENDVEKILHLPDISDVMGLRDRAILETFYNTGVRRSELANIKIGDIDINAGALMIRQGKGKKDRYIPIGERAVAWIEKYLYEARESLACARDEGELFLSYTGQALHPGTLTSLVSRYISRANIGKTGSCHLFRHAMATLMLENGADLRFIQAMLGHTDIGTTEVYTHVSIKKLKEIHNQTHPGASLNRNRRKEAAKEQEAEMLSEEQREDNLWEALQQEEQQEATQEQSAPKSRVLL